MGCHCACQYWDDAVGTMQIDFVANITVSASLQIIFATDTRSSPAGMVIGVPRTLCFAAKTVRSQGELHCLITKQHCSNRRTRESIDAPVSVVRVIRG